MTRPTARVGTMAVGCVVALSVAACGASSPPRAPGSSAAPATSRSAATTAPPPPATTAAPRSTATTSAPASTSAAPSRTVAAPSSTTPPVTTAPTAGSAPDASRNESATSSDGARPVIVIDPGHSPSVHHIDRRTGLDVSDYENEPEMHDVYKVALIVRRALLKAGYRVVMTKTSVDERVNLARRAYIANRVHAALAISIHDQAGSNGGIGFRAGNNTVYYQSVGTYRETPAGKKVYFRDKDLAKISKKYGAIFRRQRVKAQGVHVNLQGNVGYNLGSRGLAPGNIWIVQLLSKVPWIYNEAGGNSAGRSGLDSADKHTYARGLIAGVEHSVPLPKS